MTTALFRLLTAAALFALAACNGNGGVKVFPAPTASPGAATAAIAVSVQTTPSSAIAGITVVAAPTSIGGASYTTNGACSASGCTITAAAPSDFTAFTINLTNASGATVLTGSFGEDVVADGNQPFAVTFGGTPASVDLSTAPGYFTIGQSASATLEALVYDAQDRRLIGNIPFATPIAVALNDPSGTTALSSTSIANPAQAVNFSYNGGKASTVVLTPALAGATAQALTVPIVLPPTTLNGNTYGDMKFDTAEELASIPTAPPAPPVPLGNQRRAQAAVVDLSGSFPPIGNQNPQSSCVAWSATYADLTYTRNKGQVLTGSGPFGINTATVFSPSFMYNQLNGGVDQGLNMTTAARFLVRTGGVPWATFPWVGSDYLTQPSASVIAQGRANAVARFYLIPDGAVATMKSWLSAGYPILWGAEVDDTFLDFSTAQVWTGPLDGGAAGGHGAGHAMVIVGYDDTKQAFKIFDSWGTTWGGAGMAYISYAWWSIIPGNENFVFTNQ